MTEPSAERRYLLTANPASAIIVYPLFCRRHERFLTRREWVERNLALLEEIGPERWMHAMLDALEGADETAP